MFPMSLFELIKEPNDTPTPQQTQQPALISISKLWFQTLHNLCLQFSLVLQNVEEVIALQRLKISAKNNKTSFSLPPL